MTVSFFALYRTPPDADAFDSAYFGTHVPIVAGTPGLLENKVHRVKRQLVGEPAYYLVAELVFADAESMKAAFKSPEWGASGANLQEWGGMDLVTMFTTDGPDAIG
ncbi:MAG: EthD family reductase [Geodermatophilaceae bacterium]|nr:EthD family reductase [Geodermatophilaceae bacterium]